MVTLFTGMLVYFYAGTIQHKCRSIDNILLDQIDQDILPYAGFCLCTKSTVNTLPRPKSFRQIFPLAEVNLWFYSIIFRLICVFSYHQFTRLTLCIQVGSFKTRPNLSSGTNIVKQFISFFFIYSLCLQIALPCPWPIQSHCATELVTLL